MTKNKFGIDKKEKLNEKQWKSYMKFYDQYKDLSLDELQKVYMDFKNPPGGTKKMALLQLANDKMAAIREQTMKEAAEAITPVREEVKQEKDESSAE